MPAIVHVQVEDEELARLERLREGGAGDGGLDVLALRLRDHLRVRRHQARTQATREFLL